MTAECAAHEAGHGFGLQHQSSYDLNGMRIAEYNHGNAMMAPIMGGSYSAARGLWWNGPTTSAAFLQDDVSIIGGEIDGFGLRPNGHAQRAVSAETLTRIDNSFSASGIIARTTDQDYFGFTTTGGAMSIKVDVAALGPMLHAKLELRSASDQVLVTAADPTTLGQSIVTNLPAGQYFVVVKSFGSYGDLGQYKLSVSAQ